MTISIENILELYIKGKDEDKYHLLEDIYSKSAEVEFEINSDNISFPSTINGNIEIAKVLSKDFNQNYTKVKTYYLVKPQPNQLKVYKQNWLVVMKDIATGLTRVGTGHYDWHLIKSNNGLKIEKHNIYIHVMTQIIDDDSAELVRIQKELNYPWVKKENVLHVLAGNDSFECITQYLK